MNSREKDSARPDSMVVAASYRLLLGREAGPTEVQDKLNVGYASNWQLFLSFIQSEEFSTRPGLQNFCEVFSRVISERNSEALAFLASATGDGQSFARSDMRRSNLDFVFGCYIFLLRRLPDPFSFCMHWRLLETNIISHFDLVRSFLHSAACPSAIRQQEEAILGAVKASGLLPPRGAELPEVFVAVF